jgi:hypothetical protein
MKKNRFLGYTIHRFNFTALTTSQFYDLIKSAQNTLGANRPPFIAKNYKLWIAAANLQ